MPSPADAVIALAPSDFVLVALLAFALLYVLPRHLLHYWGRGAPPAAAATRRATRHRRAD
jgi:hypothetical protein